MVDLKAFAEQLVSLTVKEVNELAGILKADYGIEPAAAAPVMVAGGGGGSSCLIPLNRIVFVMSGDLRLNMYGECKTVPMLSSGIECRQEKQV